MKQLTQAIFKDAPDWARSAAVDAHGTAIYYEVSKDKLKPWLDVPFPMMVGGFRTRDAGHEYDSTNWQNSAIDRESVK